MNRVASGYRSRRRSVTRQNAFTKVDFLKTRMLLKLLVLLGFVVLLSIFYVWSKVRIVQMGYEINEYKYQQVVLQDQNRRLKMEYAWLVSPDRLKAFAVKKGMSYPDYQRIVEIE
jgi:cell division protein FtsL